MAGWCVTVEVTLDGYRPTDPRVDDDAVYEALSDLLTALEELPGSVAGDGRGWAATVTVDAADMDAAREQALGTVLAHADECGLAVAPVTRVEVVREDVRDAELELPTLPDLVSGPEAAEILGVSRQRVHQLAHSHRDFPRPLYRLGAGSLWARSAVEAFADRWERRPGRPPRSA